MGFVDNFWHGDLHPGNLLVLQGEPHSQPCLAVLDAGISGSLAGGDRRNLADVFRCVLRGDGRGVGELFLSRSSHTCTDREAFLRDMASLVTEARGQALSLERVDVPGLLSKVFAT